MSPTAREIKKKSYSSFTGNNGNAESISMLPREDYYSNIQFFFFKAQSSEITVMEQLVGLLVRDNQVPLSFGSSNI